MKKLILAFITVAFIGLGSAPASAQTPSDCGENTITFQGKQQYCESVLPAVYPVESVAIAPPAAPVTTTTIVLPQPPGALPATGSSGVSSILGLGVLLMVGGGIVVVATRRRSSASSPVT